MTQSSPYEGPEFQEWQEYVSGFFDSSPLLPEAIRDRFMVFLMAASTATLQWVLVHQMLCDILDTEDPVSIRCYEFIANELEARGAGPQRARVGS